MKIALAQMKMEAEIEKNYRESLRLLKEAAGLGAELVLFPEVQLTPFFPQYADKRPEDYAIPMDHPYVRGICAACRDAGIFAAPNFYIEEGGKRYDMSLLVDDAGAVIGRQKMVHIAQCEHFYEQSYYAPSEEGFAVFDTRLGKIGFVVCFDRHYPESVRTLALRGTELVLIPTANTADEPSELFQWEIKIQAFQNSVNIAMCNRVGREDGMLFSGESIVADYNGDTVGLAGASEEILVAEVDLERAASVRRAKPYTGLRRKGLYE